MELQTDEGSEYAVKTFSPQETEKLGNLLGSQLGRGDVVALIGELGTGKTCFARGVATGLGIDKGVTVVSPSFTIVNEYPGTPPVYHFDLYRIDNILQVFDLGYEEYFFGEGVTIIEWGEKVDQVLPEEHFRVEFCFEDESIRKIKLSGYGRRLASLVKNLKATIHGEGKSQICNHTR